MTRTLAAVAAALACGTAWAFVAPPAPRPAAPGKATVDDLFGLSKVHDVHLTLPAKAWDEMHPKNPPRFGGGPPRGGPGGAGGGGDDVNRRGGFGYDFRYVKADVVIDGEAVKGVG